MFTNEQVNSFFKTLALPSQQNKVASIKELASNKGFISSYFSSVHKVFVVYMSPLFSLSFQNLALVQTNKLHLYLTIADLSLSLLIILYFQPYTYLSSFDGIKVTNAKVTVTRSRLYVGKD